MADRLDMMIETEEFKLRMKKEVPSLLVEDDPKKMGEYEKMKKRYGMLGLPISEVPKLNPSAEMSESYFAHPIKE